MSALQSYFNDFLSNIRLPDSLREELKKAHTELREHLKSDDITKDLLVDSFLQGSYARATCIKPEKGHKADVDVIYSESFATPRIGQAIMNRLLKAAGHQVLQV